MKEILTEIDSFKENNFIIINVLIVDPQILPFKFEQDYFVFSMNGEQ